MENAIDRLLAGLPEIDGSLFFEPHGIHGVSHTRRVLIHARRLASAVGVDPWQSEALDLAALWHDIGRIHDDADYFHGARSHGKARALRLHADADPAIADVAFFAVEQHCTDEYFVPGAVRWLADPLPYGGGSPYRMEQIMHVWRILKDADALDRVRLGSGANPGMLRFDVSRRQTDFARVLLEAVP